MEASKTAENIKKVALILFIIIGTIHIGAGLMLGSNYLLPYSLIINRSFDIPFAMTALTYASATIYTGTDIKYRKITGMGLLIICIVIFIALLYINLLIPDKAQLTSL